MVIGGLLTRTIDMSTSGICFAAVSPLSPGTPITFSLLVPGAENEISVACEGRVVRVERHGESSHVAATIESMSFEQSNRTEGRKNDVE